MTLPTPETRSFCNACQRETRHAVAGIHSRQHIDGNGQFPRIIDEEWQLLYCLGCESIKTCVIESSTDFKTPRETHYPAIQSRIPPAWIIQLPPQFHDLIKEVYIAINSQCPCLSTMGTRALIDEMLSDLLGDVGGFSTKLNGAVINGFLTEKQRQTIEAAVEAGHATIHRGFRPSIQQVFDALDIVEHALMDGYVMNATSGRLAASVPPRQQERK